MADESESMPEGGGTAPAAPAAAESQKPSGGGLQEFLFQFLKANPDLAREMSTRMNAVIHGQRLQGLKGTGSGGGIPVPNPGQLGIRGEAPQAAPPPPAGQPPMKMAGDVIPIPGEKSMGPGESPDAAGYALGQQTQPGIIPVPNDVLRSWYERARARQG